MSTAGTQIEVEGEVLRVIAKRYRFDDAAGAAEEERANGSDDDNANGTADGNLNDVNGLQVREQSWQRIHNSGRMVDYLDF